MCSKTFVQPALTLNELSDLILAHRQWLRSAGKEGQKANLSGANLEGLDLDGFDLSQVDFREANLSRVRFGDALVEGAKFRASDLRKADLSGVRGLLAPQLAGADLAGAKLPKDLQEFTGLKHVDTASGHVQRLFFLLLLVCVYCWLAIAVTTDADFFSNVAEQPLPIIGTKINLVMFYWAAPFLLLCVYLYFHLCLQRLWEALAELPGVFPDGLSLPHRVHPWLWNGLVWAYSPRLKDRRPPLMGLQKILAIFLVWWAGPLTILAFWYRYLQAHDWTITTFHLVLLTLALDGALGFSLLTRVTLRLEKRKPFRMFTDIVLALATLGIIGLFYFFTVFAIGLSMMPPNLTGADISQKPPQWKSGDFDLVRGAFLKGRDLSNANASGAFLVKADLHGADLVQAHLSGANLWHAHLQHANLELAILRRANLQQADLFMAKLQGANLRSANLQGANLAGADFRWAQGLVISQVRAARCWRLAKYSPEMLKVLGLPHDYNERLARRDLSGYHFPRANLRGAHLYGVNFSGANLQGSDLGEANLAAAELTGADLRGANLKGTDLHYAKGLTREQLQSAIIDENTKLPDDLKDLVPSGSPKQ